MPNTLQKPRVHQAIIQAIKAGPFYRADYDASTDELQDVDENAAPVVVPVKSVKCNETDSRFQVATKYGRQIAADRITWSFLAQVDFHREVISERFEEALLANPLCLPADPSSGLRPVEIGLVSVRYEHSPTHQSRNGSRLYFTFDARPLRR